MLLRLVINSTSVAIFALEEETSSSDSKEEERWIASTSTETWLSYCGVA